MARSRFNQKSPAKILLAITLICVGVLITAYIMEHLFGILPCQMCLYERNVFMVVGIASCLSYFLLPARFHSPALIVMGVVFMGGSALAAYHVAVQQHWVSLPSFCAANEFGGLDSVEALKEQMMKTPLVRCDQVTWSLFGLSLAAYNALLSFILALTCWAWVKRRR